MQSRCLFARRLVLHPSYFPQGEKIPWSAVQTEEIFSKGFGKNIWGPQESNLLCS